MGNNATTICINGELKPGDLVLSTPDHKYACLVGTVLSIRKAGTPEHSARAEIWTEAQTDIVHVNFLDANYPKKRIFEIQDMLAEMYGRPTSPGTWPPVDIEDVMMPPGALIRITGIDRDILRSVLGSRKAAESVCKITQMGHSSTHFNEPTSRSPDENGKQSVLAQLRESAKNPKEPSKQMKKRNNQQL